MYAGVHTCESECLPVCAHVESEISLPLNMDLTDWLVWLATEQPRGPPSTGVTSQAFDITSRNISVAEDLNSQLHTFCVNNNKLTFLLSAVHAII